MASLLDTVWTPIVDGWWGGYSHGYSYPLSTTIPDAEVESAKPQKPDGEEHTGRQGPAAYTGFGSWGLGPPLRAGYSVYRQLLRIPSLALVRGDVFGSILGGSWSIDADEGTPELAKTLLEQTILPQRTCILRHALRSLDFGFSPFEIVKAVKGGRRVIAYFKPLRWEMTTILERQSTGEFAGFKQHGTDGQRIELLVPDAWLYTSDGEPGELRGRSRLENCREAASKWLEVQTRIGRLIDKESGSVVVVTYPPGSGRDENNAVSSNRAIGESTAMNAAAGTAYLAVENALGALTPLQRKSATVDQIAELLKLKLWGIDNVSMGGNGMAIAAMQAYAAYLDTQMIRAYLRPERGLIEGQHGTKAEAASHTDTGTTDSERIEADIVEGLNCGPVDDFLADNFGDELRGKVRIKAHPLRDVQEGIDTALIHDLATNTATADEFYRTYDVDAIVERRGISKRKTPLPPAAKPEPPQPPPVPPVNGKPNGKMNGDRMAMLSSLFGDDD